MNRLGKLELIGISTMGLLLALVAQAVSSAYTEAMFRRAMSKDNPASASLLSEGAPKDQNVVHVSYSTTPLYVLITMRDPKTGRDREICTLSTYLMGAIAEEHHLDVLNDARKIFQIAMSAPDRRFEFKNKKARENVDPAYTPEQLAEVRNLLRGKSQKQLCEEVRVNLWKSPDEQSALTKIYRRNKGRQFSSSASYRVAVAQFLLEHGILVGEAHDTGTLYVDETSCHGKQ